MYICLLVFPRTKEISRIFEKVRIFEIFEKWSRIFRKNSNIRAKNWQIRVFFFVRIRRQAFRGNTTAVLLNTGGSVFYYLIKEPLLVGPL